MARVLITDTYLGDIADAIRDKLDVETMYTPPQMAGAIASIPTGSEPVLQSKTATENGTVTPDSGYDGLSSVVVDVSGGSNIIYGAADPVAAQGSDGDVYFKYEVYSGYESLLPGSYNNLDNWAKNAAGFNQFDNTYIGGENTLVHTGGNGYERIYVQVPLDQDTDYVFGLKYYSPSGVYTGYGGQLNIKASYASASDMSSGSQLSNYAVMTNLSISAEANYSDYSLTFNSGNNTSVYLVIDLNISDNKQCTLKFKDLVFYKVGEPPVAVDGKIIRNAYLKQNGVWSNAIGAIID